MRKIMINLFLLMAVLNLIGNPEKPLRGFFDQSRIYYQLDEKQHAGYLEVRELLEKQPHECTITLDPLVQDHLESISILETQIEEKREFLEQQLNKKLEEKSLKKRQLYVQKECHTFLNNHFMQVGLSITPFDSENLLDQLEVIREFNQHNSLEIRELLKKLPFVIAVYNHQELVLKYRELIDSKTAELKSSQQPKEHKNDKNEEFLNRINEAIENYKQVFSLDDWQLI